MTQSALRMTSDSLRASRPQPRRCTAVATDKFDLLRALRHSLTKLVLAPADVSDGRRNRRADPARRALVEWMLGSLSIVGARLAAAAAAGSVTIL